MFKKTHKPFGKPSNSILANANLKYKQSVINGRLLI